MDYTEEIYNEAFILIEKKVKTMGGKGLEYYGLPEPKRSKPVKDIPHELSREKNYDKAKLTSFIQENEGKLIEDQMKAYTMITEDVSKNKGGQYFIDAPGGTGKTFLLNLILAKIRKDDKIAIAVASSGIAATLLTGGRTAHSVFKLPIDLLKSKTCNIKRGSGTAQLMQECSLIVWDECTMTKKEHLEAVDIAMKDLRRSKKTMGGITLVLAGDFRQTLPVIPKGTRQNQILASIMNSKLWKRVKRLSLKTNMRVHLKGDVSASEFASRLLELGNGKMGSDDGIISVNQIGQAVASLNELKDKVFPNLSNNYEDHQWLCQRAILSPRNDTMITTNEELLSQLPGQEHSYKSIDTVTSEEFSVDYPIEFLNSLEVPGVPSHILNLKIGSPILLLRNLQPPKLCNGTKLVVSGLNPNVIEAIIVTGKKVYLPQAPLMLNKKFLLQVIKLKNSVYLLLAIFLTLRKIYTPLIGYNFQFVCVSQ